MELLIPPIYETKLTGYRGTVSRKVRGVTYSVRFVQQAGELAAIPSRDGRVADWCKVTRKLDAAGRKFFASADKLAA